MNLGHQERLRIVGQKEGCPAEKPGTLWEKSLDELYSRRQGILVVQQQGRAMSHQPGVVCRHHDHVHGAAPGRRAGGGERVETQVHDAHALLKRLAVASAASDHRLLLRATRDAASSKKTAHIITSLHQVRY